MTQKRRTALIRYNQKEPVSSSSGELGYWEALTPNQKFAAVGVGAFIFGIGAVMLYSTFFSAATVLVGDEATAIASVQAFMRTPSWRGRPSNEHHTWSATVSPLGGYIVSARHPLLGGVEFAVSPEGSVTILKGAQLGI